MTASPRAPAPATGAPDETRAGAPIPFDNSYARLPEGFFARLDPTPVADPRILRVNDRLAAELGIEPARLATREGAEWLAGNRVPEGAEPIAQAYAGHQFGNWVPQLGDGRAILLGEVIDGAGQRRDIQLKGSGRTPFSRMGDGRAPLGPVLREFILSEAMAALGVPTTRSLAAVATGEEVRRETVLPGAVLTRVAASHVRVGTFQFFYARKDTAALETLAGHVIARHYPEAAGAEVPADALLDAVIGRQAALVARWMSLGFIHGVMNTDNMTISGETIDYGPCAFMEAFDPRMVFSSIDVTGRYAYANQPLIAQWNLAQFAQALLPLLGPPDDETVARAQARIDAFPARFKADWLALMRAKLGLATARDEDEALIDALFEAMAEGGADFTLTFRRLADAADPGPGEVEPRALFADPARFDAWAEAWRARLAHEPAPAAERRRAMRAVNPLFIPRNHLVEEAIAAAMADDLAPFDTLVDTLSHPFDEQPGRERLAEPAKPHEMVHQTFCGT